MVEILAYHGWAHDSSCWSKLEKQLGENVLLKACDRGYFFNNKVEVSFSEKTTCKIVMCHSFGLHHVPTHLFSRIDGLIIISSFLTFGKSKILERMSLSLETNTALVLGQFQANCAYPSQSNWIMPRVFNKALLASDLKQLGNSVFNPKLVPAGLKKLVLGGDCDKIVDIKDQQDLAKELNTNISWIRKSGHGCIYTKPEMCAAMISPFIKSCV